MSEEQKKTSGGLINRSNLILLIIAIVFAWPLITRTAGSVAGVIFTILFLPFVLICSFGGAAIGIASGGIATIAAGIAVCMQDPAGGALTMGVGFLLMALAIVFLLLAVGMAFRVVPWLYGKIRGLFRRLRGRGRKERES